MKYKRFPLGPLWANGYLVWDDEGRAFFVDPGGDPEEVIEFMEKNGIQLEMILLTHGHSDHIGGLGMLSSLTDNIYIHGDDIPLLSDSAQNLSMYTCSAPFSISLNVKQLSDGDVIRMGQLSINIIHTPGHTKGGCCFYVETDPDPLLFSGDTLFASSIGRTDFPGGDYSTLIKSLSKLSPYPDETKVLPGHGPETTLGRERKVNPYWPR